MEPEVCFCVLIPTAICRIIRIEVGWELQGINIWDRGRSTVLPQHSVSPTTHNAERQHPHLSQ